MSKKRSLALVLLLGLLALGLAACSGDDNPVTVETPADPWVGTWISAGANVAPIVYADPVNVDTVIVTFNANNTITLVQHNHVTDTWSTNTGTYDVTKSATGDIHAISISYTNPAFDQLGIIQVTDDGSKTRQLKLEVVISTYTTVPTPEGGFGADGVLGTLNIQTYVPTETEISDDPWVGVWLSAGADVAPIVYADPVNVDSVYVTFNANNTITLVQHNHVTDQWTTNPGTYSVDAAATDGIHAISISYSNPAFDQLGIIRVVDGTPDVMTLEVVISTYTTVPTPEGGFGADGVLGTLNIQTYRRQ